MNRLLAFLIFIFLSLASSRSFAEWIEINKSVSGNTFYMDTAKIKNNNGKVYYWTIQDYLKPGSHRPDPSPERTGLSAQGPR